MLRGGDHVRVWGVGWEGEGLRREGRGGVAAGLCLYANIIPVT